MDAALLDCATHAGAEVRRGIAVRAIEGRTVRYADGGSETPDRLILATGKHDLRGAARPVASRDPAMGLRWRYPASERMAARIGDAIELHLFAQGYAGLVMQEAGHANLCLAIRRSAFVAAGRNPAALLDRLFVDVPGLAQLAGEAMGEAQAIANVPYGWRARGDAGGIYRVGDQVGVIPSLAGEGVGIALATGIAAGRAILAGQGPSAYQEKALHRIARPIRTAGLLWHLAERPPWPGLHCLSLRECRDWHRWQCISPASDLCPCDGVGSRHDGTNLRFARRCVIDPLAVARGRRRRERWLTRRRKRPMPQKQAATR